MSTSEKQCPSNVQTPKPSKIKIPRSRYLSDLAGYGIGRGEPKQPYPAKPESPDKYTSYHLYVSDDLINEIVTIGKESLKGLMPYKA